MNNSNQTVDLQAAHLLYAPHQPAEPEPESTRDAPAILSGHEQFEVLLAKLEDLARQMG